MGAVAGRMGARKGGALFLRGCACRDNDRMVVVLDVVIIKKGESVFVVRQTGVEWATRLRRKRSRWTKERKDG